MEALSRSERRRSARVLWRTPVFVVWEPRRGLKLREQAETEVVNAHGALLRLNSAIPSGRSLQLLDPRSQECKAARVVWSNSQPGHRGAAAVELCSPSESFWGIYIPIQTEVVRVPSLASGGVR